MSIQSFLDKVESDPKLLFVIDGIGALLSAILLGVVLVQFEQFFGIPKATLYLLASIPIFFAVYDFISYQKGKRIRFLLQGIAFMNVLYCGLSIGFAFYHQDTLTPLGWTYILTEILIVLTLAKYEFSVASKIKI